MVKIPDAPVVFHLALLARTCNCITNDGNVVASPSHTFLSGAHDCSYAVKPDLVARLNGWPEENRSIMGAVAGWFMLVTAAARACIAAAKSGGAAALAILWACLLVETILM